MIDMKKIVECPKCGQTDFYGNVNVKFVSKLGKNGIFIKEAIEMGKSYENRIKCVKCGHIDTKENIVSVNKAKPDRLWNLMSDDEKSAAMDFINRNWGVIREEVERRVCLKCKK